MSKQIHKPATHSLGLPDLPSAHFPVRTRITLPPVGRPIACVSTPVRDFGPTTVSILKFYYGCIAILISGLLHYPPLPVKPTFRIFVG